MDILKNKKKFEEMLFKKIKGKRVFDHTHFYVCSPCQNNCRSCQNEELRISYKNYQLSINELNRFIYYTKKSNYYYCKIIIQGVGEPTLWDHFNEGIKLLHDSGITTSIIVYSNGISVDNIEEETWQYLDIVRFSIFPHTKNKDHLDVLRRKYGEHKIIYANYDSFVGSIDKRYVGTTPCRCLCPGPSFIKDKVFFYCAAGPILTAAKIMGVNIFDYENMYSEVKENYLDRSDVDVPGARSFEFCESCVLNSNIFPCRKRHKHEMI
jgi:organic radical activating enzyme